jgi:phosphatidylglycerol:prolipoprotein diacylglycerol transferase
MRPILFRLFGLPLYSYGVMLGLSLVVGWFLTLGLCERDGLDRRVMGRCYLWTAAAAIAGARLLYVLTNLERFDHLTDLLKLNQGGLVAYGGFLGGLVGSAIFCRVARVPLVKWADCAVPSLCTGLAITRVGCFLFGCDFGVETGGPLGVRFPAGSPAFNQQRMTGLLGPEATESLPVHPTQLYEVLIGLVLFAVVMWARRRRRFSGQPFLTFFLGYGVLRFAVESLRGDEQRGGLFGMSTSQLIAIATIVAAGALWPILARAEARPATAGTAPTGAAVTKPGKRRRRR